MLSLYLHIPFCVRKCNFCSFHVIPEDLADQESIELRKDQCLAMLIQESDQWKKIYTDTQIRTIHIGGGTPFQLGAQRLETLMDTLLEDRDCEFLEELTIELNPDPIEEVLQLVAHFQEKYKHLYKLRFSFGIQTFDDALLQKSGRNYAFEQLQEFFRSLRAGKKHHGISYNADFIAFGTQDIQIKQRDFFRNVLQAKLFDSISLYTLELFPGSQRRNESKHLASSKSPLRGDDDQIMDEFLDYQELIDRSGYHRYEISNFSLMGKRSIHNMVYRTHGSYLGMGPSAASFLTGKELETYMASGNPKGFETNDTTKGIRWKNSLLRNQRIAGNQHDEVECLDTNEMRYEKIMLGLRTDHGITNLPEYSSLLLPDYETRIEERVGHGLCTYQNQKLVLTDVGMSVYNSLLNDLVA